MMARMPGFELSRHPDRSTRIWDSGHVAWFRRDGYALWGCALGSEADVSPWGQVLFNEAIHFLIWRPIRGDPERNIHRAIAGQIRTKASPFVAALLILLQHRKGSGGSEKLFVIRYR